MKHFISIKELTSQEALDLVKRAAEMKTNRFTSTLLAGKSIVLIFEKASTRTRLSFEVAVMDLGGRTIFMTPRESQLGRAEPLKDTARVISRYNEGMVVRTFEESKLHELMRYGSVPVINALTNEGHPCQVMADMLTIYERTPKLDEITVTYIGDGNNMANSWIEAAMRFPIAVRLACPQGYDPNMELLNEAKDQGAKVELFRSPEEAVKGANYVYTDVWASMGQEEEQQKRLKAFDGYCVDDALMSKAAPHAKFLHCLPAHRGEEVSESVLEGSSSIVFDQAENRLHMQKAIIERAFLK